MAVHIRETIEGPWPSNWSERLSAPPRTGFRTDNLYSFLISHEMLFGSERPLCANCGHSRRSAFAPDVWSGRALQEVFVDLASAVLHQCIRSLIGAVLLRTIMDISARAFSLADRPQRAIRVTSVRMRREDRSSISSYPLADLGG